MALRSRRRGLFGKILFFLFALGAAAAIVIVGLVFVYRSVPPTSTLMLARWIKGQPTTRIYVPLGEISPNLQGAVIASEIPSSANIMASTGARCRR